MGKRGSKPGTPEARRGGLAVRDGNDEDYYRVIGRQGGLAVKARKEGTDFFAQIGRLGGEATKARHGADYYAEIGSKGGSSKKSSKA